MTWKQTKRQRHKLYAAEEAAIGFGGFFSSVEAAQGWVDRQIARKWWRSVSPIRSVLVRYPSYKDSGSWRPDPNDASHGELEAYCSRLCEQTLTHEMAHLLLWVPGTDDEADHGPAFAGALLYCTKWTMGAVQAEALRECFEERKIAVEPFQIATSKSPDSSG